MSVSNGYRADIDGLRALAILPVLLFHAGVPGFSGGYVGVDIFFVISGFLITAIIAREVDADDFSILRFYERRARRIMPALLVMIAVVLFAAVALFLPDDLSQLPRSAIAATLFVSNIGFFLDVGYFSGGAETKPLLHTWSLAVEEQFYIGLPILLLLVARWLPGSRRAIVALAALASFAIAVATQSAGDGFAFYLLPARAWELLAGSLLALGAAPAIERRWLREAWSLAGTAAILFAVVHLNKDSIFPGVNALYPVLGAAVLIHCAPGTMVGRLLSLKPLTAIGLISYSLYLWHWPVIVFATYATQMPLSGSGRVAVVAVSLLLALMSWRFIERPFRRPVSGRRKRLFAWTGRAMASICLVATGMVLAGGMPDRFPAEVIRMAGASGDFSPMRDTCHDSDAARGRPPCILGAKAVPTAILWGDSHGVEIAYELSRSAQIRGESLIERTQSSCPPLLGYDLPADARCKAANDAAFASIRDDPGLRTVYLAAFWASDSYASPAVAAELDQTIAALTALGRKVVIFGPVPPNRFDVPRRLAMLAYAGRLGEARGRSRDDVRRQTQWMAPVLARWQGRGVTLIDSTALLCRTATCDIMRDGMPLYFDAHHPSLAGARLLAAAALPGQGLMATASTSGARRPPIR